jgi:uncharacterized protein YndB with AHSA1/START domain
MTTAGTATASIEVAGDPKTAFTVFTDEIGLWWKRDTHYWNDPRRGLSLRFEPGVGGRLVEVYSADTGEGFEIGRVSVWEPGERLVFGWREAGWPPDRTTEVEVRFEAVDGGTRVTVEHRGWDDFGAEAAGRTAGYSEGWAELLGFYAERAN